MNDKIERQCPVCSRMYNADPNRLKHGRQTTCSRACSYKARADGMTNREQMQCGGCGKLVERSPSLAKRPRHGHVFCSRTCAYRCRQRVVDKPYALVAVYDRGGAADKAWKTRRANPRPYPEAARAKARADAIEKLKRGFAVSDFERKATKVFRALGFNVNTSIPFRGDRGRLAFVFDIGIGSRRILIECHGTYWHGGRWSWEVPTHTQTNNLAREARKHAAARAAGLDLRLLWEHDFKRDPVGACLSAAR